MFKKAQSILIIISILTLHEKHKRKNVTHTGYDTEVRTKRTVPIKRVEINIPRKCHDCQSQPPMTQTQAKTMQHIRIATTLQQHTLSHLCPSFVSKISFLKYLTCPFVSQANVQAQTLLSDAAYAEHKSVSITFWQKINIPFLINIPFQFYYRNSLSNHIPKLDVVEAGRRIVFMRILSKLTSTYESVSVWCR